MKKFFALLLAGLVALTVVGCSTESEDSSKVISDIPESSQQSSQEDQQKEPEQSNETSEENQEGADTAKVGQSVEGPNWKISLTSAKTYEKIGDTFEEKPEDGKVYLICFFEVENVSDEDDYFNYFNIESYVDGYNEDISITMSDVEGMSLLTGDVAAGKKLKGYLAWEVSPEWKELEISYKDNLWTGEKAATFVVTPDQLVA